MADLPQWPSLLPCPLLEGVSYTPQANAIRSQMDAGPARMRRRFTRVPEDVTFSLILSQVQMQVLRDFVEITLADVLPFAWKEFRHPGDGYVAHYRFKSRPKVAPINGRRWRADIELELLSRPPQGPFPLANEAGAVLTLDDGTILTL